VRDSVIKSPGQSLFGLALFWVAVVVPLLLALWTGYVGFAGSGLTFIQALNRPAYFIAPLLVLSLMIPAVVLVGVNHRSKQQQAQFEQQRVQQYFANHYLHTEQFSSHMNNELLKRLGMSARVIHKMFYPGSTQGDFAVNSSLVNFISLKFAEIVQAAQVVVKLDNTQEDDDEKAVAQNRVEFVLSHSVNLMYFFAGQVRGHSPECNDFYFLKDALADYFDLINDVINFDGISDSSIDLCEFRQLFAMGDVKAWFARHDNFLTILCSESEQDNSMLKAFNRAQIR
jgi:hypothetical protein